MDETNGTTQDSPQPGKALGSEEGTTPTEPQTYTKAQVDEAVQAARIKAGREAKALEKRAADLEAQEKKIADWQKKRDEEELELAKDNPDQLDIVQQKKKLRDDRAKIAEERAAFEKERESFEQELAESKEAKRDIAIWKIASNKLDPVKLKELCDKLNAQTEEQIKAIADNLQIPGNPGVKPDSGVTTGSGEPTQEQMSKMPMEEYIAHRKKQNPNLI